MRLRKITQLFLVFIGIIMIVSGVIRGEVNAVISKAIKICLECVGIG